MIPQKIKMDGGNIAYNTRYMDSLQRWNINNMLGTNAKYYS